MSGDGLEGLVEATRRRLRDSVALARKRAIGDFVRPLAGGLTPPGWPDPFGEDAAPIPWGDHFLLLAADGVAPSLLDDPWWAGYCAVLVNVNDVAATGGSAVALVDIVSGPDPEWRAEVARGLAYASRHLGVPIVGGHVHPDDGVRSVSVAVLGRAELPILCVGARPGDDIVAIADVEGSWRAPFPNWDSTSHRTSAEARAHLDLLPALARAGRVTAGKDVSNPGWLGTLLMLLESSDVGALIDLDAFPRPSGVGFESWDPAYPGFGFLLTTGPDQAAGIVADAKGLGLAAAVCGRVQAGSELACAPRPGMTDSAVRTVWDHRLDPVTGIRAT